MDDEQMGGIDGARAGLLGELAADAAIERSSFLVDATDQLRRFLDANADRIRQLGGLVLIDDDPDYLSVAPDGSFRSRSRYQDEATGEWVSETEVIENASELVELYNPAEIYASFAEAAREEAGLPDEPTAADDLMDTAGISPDETVGVGIGGRDPYAGAADDWAAMQPADLPRDEASAARRLYDLSLTFQERSQLSEARLVEQFEVAASSLGPLVGDQMILDDDDERLWFKSSGRFEAEVVPEREDGDTDVTEPAGEWRRLTTPDELVEFYDPTDVFGDLAESLAETFPEVAPDFQGFGDEDAAAEGEAEGVAEVEGEAAASDAPSEGAAGDAGSGEEGEEDRRPLA